MNRIEQLESLLREARSHIQFWSQRGLCAETEQEYQKSTVLCVKIAMLVAEPVEYPSVVHERVDAIATFDSVAQGPSSPQVTPPKYDPSWHGSQAHTFVTDKPVGSEVKPRTGDKS